MLKISLLLDKLDVSINMLQLIGERAGIDIKDKHQVLPYNDKLKLQSFINSYNSFANLKNEIREEYSKTIADAYFDGKFYYFIGYIKWFSDTDKEKNYGFVTIKNIGDIYFHTKDVYQSSLDKLQSGSMIYIRIDKNQILLDSKKKAASINFWSDEENIAFLVHLKINLLLSKEEEESIDFLLTKLLLNLDENQKNLLLILINNIPAECFKISHLDFYENLFKSLDLELKDSLFLNNLNIPLKFEVWLKEPSLIDFEEIKEIIKAKISSKKEIINNLFSISINLLEDLFKETLQEITETENNELALITLFSNAQSYKVNLVVDSLPNDICFKLWKKELYRIPVETIYQNISNILLDKESKIPAALLKEDISKIEDVFLYAVNFELNQRKNQEVTSMVPILTLFRKAQTINLKIPLDTIDNFTLHRLWRHQLVEKPIISEIYKDHLKTFSAAIKKDSFNIQILEKEYSTDFQRLNNEEISNLLAAHFYEIENFNKNDYQYFKALLKLDISQENKEKLTHLVKQKTDDYGKLRLFIDNYIDSINFDNAILYTALLTSEQQKLFFKKCLSLVEKGKANWQIKDFKRIVSIDYQLYAQAKNIGDFKLDFSLSMILHLANKISNGQTINTQSIFQLVADIIEEPKELLQITGFFDKCHGRQSIKQITNDDPDSKEAEFELRHYSNSNPRFSTYCDGRKAIDKQTQAPTTCSRSGFEFHWCENTKCYAIARIPHSTNDWENYSLADVLRILDIPFSDKQYEQLIGVINKANHFFEHLNCRKCKHILHPSGKDNYGIYRVSNFTCNNPDCDENENIYLSHCANGACLDIVDSRDSVRCKTNGSSNNGWYVCNNCHACCTSKNIQSRAYRLRQMGIDNEGPTEGHWDRQEICCNKCGTEMEKYKPNYYKVLKWYLEHKDNHQNITKTGINKFNKHWFLWQQGNYTEEQYLNTVDNFKRSGFHIPDFKDKNRSSYLIAEPKNPPHLEDLNLRCPACEYKMSIRKNALPTDQYYAIKKYHFEKIKT